MASSTPSQAGAIGATGARIKPPAFLFALGDRPPPERIRIGECGYQLERVFKNDFFAITLLYRREDPGSERPLESGAVEGYSESHKAVVLKINRQSQIGPIPLTWMGRILAWHEAMLYNRLQGLSGVPEFLGLWPERESDGHFRDNNEGFFARTGVLHAFVPGRLLNKGCPVADDFHPRLEALVRAIHARGVACVDLEKCENVLLAETGEPFLFDFQIAWYWPRRWGGDLPPFKWLRERLQAADLYHLKKLKRRTRPDLMTEEELRASHIRPWYIELHRIWTRPLTRLRRAVLNKLDPRSGDGERGRVSE